MKKEKLRFETENLRKIAPLLRDSGEGSMDWTEKGMKARRWRETGSRTSSITSGTETNLSAHWESLSPPSIMALASTTATAMPLVDLQLSAKTPTVGLGLGFGGFGAVWFFRRLLQHGAGDGFGVC